MKILLNSVEKVKDFINISSRFRNIKCLVKSGRYIVDGSSLMGMFSMDLTKPLEVEISSKDVEAVKKFEKEISQYIV